MNIDGLSSELDRLRTRLGPALCAERHCATITHTELLLLPGGRTERVGSLPPPLCSNCPEREAKVQRIRHVEVARDYRGRYAQQAADSAPRITHNGQGAAEVTPNTPAPEAPTQANVTPDDEGVDAVMRLARRMQEQEDAEAAKHEGRNRNRGTPLFNPSDFGV